MRTLVIKLRKVVEKAGGIKEERYYLGNYEVYRKFVGVTLETERTTAALTDDKRKIATIDKLTVENSSLINLPLAVIRYQFDNHLGSASLELDQNAQIISYEEYHPFGTTSYRSGRSETEVSLKRYKYVGKERDEETGLYYYGFRYYAAWIARFINVDPLQHEYPHYTPFQYAGNKPVTYVDLDGLEEGIVFGSKAQVKAINDHPGNDNYLGVELKTLRDAINYVKGHKESGNSVKVIYLTSHGTPGSVYLGEGADGEINTKGVRTDEYYKNDDVSVSAVDISWFLNMSETDREKTINNGNEKAIAIDELKELASLIDCGGTLILGACSVSRDDINYQGGTEFLDNLNLLTNNRIHLIANQDYTADNYSKSGDRFLFLDRPRTVEKDLKGLWFKGWSIKRTSDSVEHTGQVLQLNSTGELYEFIENKFKTQ